jgi:hypothetical protein
MSNELDLQLILSAKDQLSSVVKGAMSKSSHAVSGLENKLFSASKQMDAFGKSAIKAGGLITAAGTAAAYGLHKNIMGNVAAADRIDKLRQQIGMGTKSFQEWDYIMAQNGGQVEILKTGYRALGNQMDAYRKGSKDSIGIFRQLGVDVKKTNGQFRSQDDVFNDVILKLQGINDETQRNIWATRLFRGAAVDLKPVLNLNADATLALKNRVNELGMMMSDETIAASVKFNDTMLDVQRSFAGIGYGITGHALPYMQKFVDKLIALRQKIEVDEGFSKGLFATILGTVGMGAAITGIGLTAKAAGAATAGFANLLSMGKKVSAFARKYEAIKLTLWDSGAINAWASALKGNVAGGLKAVGTVWRYITPSNIKESWHLMRSTVAEGAKLQFANMIGGAKAFGLGLLHPIKSIKKMRLAVNALNISMMANPVGLVVGAIVAGTFLIWKYWKPLVGFFKDGLEGLKTGLAPIKPSLDAIGQALKPLTDAFGNFFGQVEGGAKGADSAIFKIMETVGKLITKITQGWSYIANLKGLLNGNAGIDHNGNVVRYDKKPDGSHANGLNRVPFDGYRAILHKDEGVLTAQENKDLRLNPIKQQGGSNSLVFSPTIKADGIKDIKELEAMIMALWQKCLAQWEARQKRMKAGAYA